MKTEGKQKCFLEISAQMEPPEKKMKGKELPKYDLNRLIEQSGYLEMEIPSSSMHNQTKEPMNVPIMYEAPSMVHPVQDVGDVPECTGMYQVEHKNLQDTLEQIEQDVTTIKSSIVQKKPKMTLHQLNIKLDIIISILNKWDN